MSYKSYYKIGSLVLVITSIALSFLIVAPFIDAENEAELHKKALEEEIKLHDELRMHRDLYLKVTNSVNPVIDSEVKDQCKQGLMDIDQTLYSDITLTTEEEMELRMKLKEINSYLSQSIYLNEQTDSESL